MYRGDKKGIFLAFYSDAGWVSASGGVMLLGIIITRVSDAGDGRTEATFV